VIPHFTNRVVASLTHKGLTSPAKSSLHLYYGFNIQLETTALFKQQLFLKV